ncbi:glycoside hydrolase family 43 protein [Bacillus alkalicellulosilyticus]|uniref:glycoside hydrolase family 43 protein n=1 Tax=Alkalihalobacterium alkalicellulosilyticum TaxID=1912214 RepID=UPI003183F02A
MNIKKRPVWLKIAVTVSIITVLLFSYFHFFQNSTHETVENPSNSLSAYVMEDVLVLTQGEETNYEVHIVMNEIPTDIVELTSEIRIPEVLEVTDVILNGEKNIKADHIEFDLMDNGIELQLNNRDDSPIILASHDEREKIVIIKMRLKKELYEEMTDEIKVERLEVVHSDKLSETYDVTGAKSIVNYTPPKTAIGKQPPNGNPLVSHKFGADPYVLVFEDRVYIYATHDVLEYDENDNVVENTYGNINRLSVISSDDLVNWTDHGEIVAAGPEGAAKWATQSWAPAVAQKVIDGEDKFFIYFANNASGIGVLTSDSPTGPWVDPIGEALILRSTPGVEDVTWLFDPAVLIDDDGRAYIYFGGGIPEGQYEMPNTARVMELGDDMVSVVGEAKPIPAPFMFENAGINKVGDTYYFTYCSNFYDGDRPEGSPPPGEIAYMTSDSPMGPWEYQGTILRNPYHFFGVGGNNHHAMFEFHDTYYIAYHAQTLSKEMGVPMGYRSTHLNKVYFNEDGTIQEIKADLEGVESVKHLNPFQRVEAETMAWNAGVQVEKADTNEENNHTTNIVITDINTGDWIAVSGVDFGDGASEFSASVATETNGGMIELRLGHPEGDLIGSLTVTNTGGWNQWKTVSTEVLVEGVHDLYLVFSGSSDHNLFRFEHWKFD